MAKTPLSFRTVHVWDDGEVGGRFLKDSRLMSTVSDTAYIPLRYFL